MSVGVGKEAAAGARADPVARRKKEVEDVAERDFHLV